MTVRKLTLAALLVALGVVTAHVIWFPAGVAKAFPVQHAINVVAAVYLGPGPAVLVALAIGILRNALGVGTPLAFPGGMVGAWLAGVAYRRTGRLGAAVLGEVVGTGILGALLAVPVARWVMGTEAAALAFVPAFLVSSATGAVLAGLLLRALGRGPAGRQEGGVPEPPGRA